MPHSPLILLSFLLLFAGCKESEDTIIEVAKAEEVEEVKVEVEPEEEPPPDKLIEPDIDPNKTVMEESSDNSTYGSGFIIRPDTSKDHKIIIIPADPNIDPGIFGGKSFNKGKRRYKEIPD